MVLARHVARLLWSTARYGLATRRLSLVVAIAIGLALVVASLAATAVAPLVLYPFA